MQAKGVTRLHDFGKLGYLLDIAVVVATLWPCLDFTPVLMQNV